MCYLVELFVATGFVLRSRRVGWLAEAIVHTYCNNRFLRWCRDRVLRVRAQSFSKIQFNNLTTAEKYALTKTCLAAETRVP
jgi:hypothetical protein